MWEGKRARGPEGKSAMRPRGSQGEHPGELPQQPQHDNKASHRQHDSGRDTSPGEEGNVEGRSRVPDRGWSGTVMLGSRGPGCVRKVWVGRLTEGARCQRAVKCAQ